MIIELNKSYLKGEILIPPSKSITQRAFAAALLRHGKTKLINTGKSNDELAALEIIKTLGANVTESSDEVLIESNGINPISDQINCGESGLSVRMFTPICSLSQKEFIINGMGSLLKRPMDFFERIFPQLNVSVKTNLGKFPIFIKGPLSPKNIEVDGSLSSQFLTGLLFAYSVQKDKTKIITVKGLQSKPYIDLTINLLKDFGICEIYHENYEKFFFKEIDISKNNLSEPFTYNIESDWSNAAFILVAGAIAGEITLKGLNLKSHQADRAILDLLISSGGNIKIENDSIKISKSNLRAFYFDATNSPDLFPPLTALAVNCQGESRIKGLKRLIHKESNRGFALINELSKLNINIKSKDDELIVEGQKNVLGNSVSSHNDHRIAMALALIGLNCKQKIIIEKAESINKSYPEFFNHLSYLGANLKTI